MSYAEVVLAHFHRPCNQFVMNAADRVGVAGVPMNGPFMVLYLRLEDSSDRIAAASFQTHGCAPSIAAGSYLCSVLPGTRLDQADRWTEAAINEALGGLPEHKRHCSALAAEALARATAPPEGDPDPVAGAARGAEESAS